MTPAIKRDPVLVTMSILAGLQLFFGGATGVSLLNDNPTVAGVMAVGVLAIAAAQGGVQFYVRGQVTPNTSVVERVVGADVIAGEANSIPAGERIRPLAEDPPYQPRRAVGEAGGPGETAEGSSHIQFDDEGSPP